MYRVPAENSITGKKLNHRKTQTNLQVCVICTAGMPTRKPAITNRFAYDIKHRAVSQRQLSLLFHAPAAPRHNSLKHGPYRRNCSWRSM